MNEKQDESDIAKIIRNRLGIVVQNHQTKALNKIIMEACQKFSCCPQEYSQKLLTCPIDSPLLEHLIANITIGETYFFRDQRQIQSLKNSILPRIIKLKREQNNLSLRIWSAGCATGEEIYTIGMMLYEILPDIKRWKLNLLGTDINTVSLKKALIGSYSEWSMRSIDDKIKQRYFFQQDHKYLLSSQVRDMVELIYLNLNDDTYPSLLNGTNAQDLILCRNVLIYFDSGRISRLMQKFCSSLADNGYLMLGASDPIHINESNLVFHQGEGMLFSRAASHQNSNVHPSTLPKKPEIKLLHKLPQQKQNVEVSLKKTVQIPSHSTITQLLAENRWIETLDAINICKSCEKKSAFLLSSEATALANLGQLDHAVNLCRESLDLDSTNKKTHFALAMILIELNQLKEAEVSLRKTLFLDPYYVIGHFRLGLLLLRNKQRETGLKSLKNAFTIAANSDPFQPVPDYQGLQYGRLAEILKIEIDLHEANKL